MGYDFSKDSTYTPPGQAMQNIASPAAPLGQPQATPDANAPDDGTSLALGAANGLTLGMAPRLYGAYKAFSNPDTNFANPLTGDFWSQVGDTYNKGVDTSNATMNAARTAHPWAFGAGDIAGSVLPSLALPGGLIARGAVMGAARGLSNSPDLNNLTEDVKNTTAGAVVGAGAGALGRAGQSIGQGHGSFLGQLLGFHPIQRAGQLAGALAVPATGFGVDATLRGNAIGNALGKMMTSQSLMVPGQTLSDQPSPWMAPTSK